jgi:multiple sugar transport system ATP-binding protein
VTHDQVEAMTMGDRIAVLSAGVIQQLGRPEELYATPANLFVAGFIGSPSMDFFAGQLRQDADGARVVIGSGGEACTVPLGGEGAEQLRSLATSAGREVVVGIRPEDFALVGADSEVDSTLTGPVEVVEYLGNEQLIYVRLPGTVVPEAVKAAQEAAPTTPSTTAGSASGDTAAAGAARGAGGEGEAEQVAAATARLPASPRIEVGARVRLGVDPAKLHLFDPITTRRLA